MRRFKVSLIRYVILQEENNKTTTQTGASDVQVCDFGHNGLGSKVQNTVRRTLVHYWQWWIKIALLRNSVSNGDVWKPSSIAQQQWWRQGCRLQVSDYQSNSSDDDDGDGCEYQIITEMTHIINNDAKDNDRIHNIKIKINNSHDYQDERGLLKDVPYRVTQEKQKYNSSRCQQALLQP